MAMIETLKARFEKNMFLHDSLKWDEVEKRLLEDKAALLVLKRMEESGGEPDVVCLDKETGKYVFFDTSKESPKGRRSCCYDEEARLARKANRPDFSAVGLAKEHGLILLSEEEYLYLQTLGEFDLKSQSWLLTPEEIRKEGGAIFGDKHYNRTFVYHNGADSYYSVRSFRAKVIV
jgi:hypothetical protein